jgi:glycosyltransferase involved in cell wall biosynthesis
MAITMASKIIFLVKSAKTPSSRIRIANITPYLNEKGIKTEIVFIPNSFVQRMKLFNKCRKYDIVVLQKRLFSWFEFYELRKNSKILAFDFDDAVYMKNRSPSANFADYNSSTRQKRFKRIIKSVDFVITANKTLAKKGEEFSEKSNIYIIPSSVNLDGMEPKKSFSLSSTPSIGWVGSKITQRYLDLLAPKLCELRKHYEFKLKVISDKEYSYQGLDIENITWDLDTEKSEIRKFDIGIMPLSSDPFSEGKASYKLLQYMAAGIPSVASSVGMNVEVADNENGALLANDCDEFIEKINLLLKPESCDLRKSLGEHGRKIIETLYSQKIVGEQFSKMFLERL